MAWHRSQALFVAATLFAVLALMSMLLFPLALYCEPGPAQNPHVSAADSAKGQASGEQESPFTKLVRSLLEAQANGERTHETWWRKFWCGTKVTDFLIAVAALWLAVLGGWQGYQLLRAVDNAERSERTLERAYVTAGPGARRWSHGSENPSDGGRVEIGIAITAGNHGKTPAYLQKVYFGVCERSAWPVIEALWPNVEEITQEVAWTDVIPPATHRGELVTKSDTFSELDHNKGYVSFGKLIYSDVFHRQHWCAWKHDVISVDGARWRTAPLAGANLSDQG